MAGIGILFLLMMIPVIIIGILIGYAIKGLLLIMSCTLAGVQPPRLVAAMAISFAVQIAQIVIAVAVGLTVIGFGLVSFESEHADLQIMLYSAPAMAPVSAWLFSKALQIPLSRGMIIFLVLLLFDLLLASFRASFMG